MRISKVLKSYNFHAHEVDVWADDTEFCGVVRVPVRHEAEGIRTWEGVMKPARMKGDKQMWRLMEPRSPEIMRRVSTKEVELWCRAKYGDEAWEGPKK